MELALESYDVCTGLLQSKPKTPEGKQYTISLPNLRADAAISVEEVSVTLTAAEAAEFNSLTVGFCFCGQIDKRLKSLERCQSLEEIQRLFEAADFESVVRLLQPTLNYGSRSKPLEFVSSAPERPAQLMLLQVRCTSIEYIYISLSYVMTDAAFCNCGPELAVEEGGPPAVFGVQRAGSERSPAAAQLGSKHLPAH